MNLTTMLEYSLVSQALEQELKLLVRLKAPEGSLRKRKPVNIGAVIDRIQQKFGYRLHVFQPFITESTVVADALNDQQTLLNSDAQHPVTRQFAALTSEILTFLRRIEPRPTAFLDRMAS